MINLKKIENLVLSLFLTKSKVIYVLYALLVIGTIVLYQFRLKPNIKKQQFIERIKRDVEKTKDFYDTLNNYEKEIQRSN